jgi:hypothetical protein
MTASEETRGRWRQHRRALRLVDVSDDEFGSGGLAQHAEPLHVRVVSLPADLELDDLVRLDDESKDWLEETRLAPWNEREAIVWGFDTTVTSSALVRASKTSAGWSRYVALHRHGGCESGFADLAWVVRDQQVLALRPIVGAVWATLALQVEAAARWGVNGPWQVLLALRSIEGAVLTNFGDGWADPFSGGRTRSRCEEANVLFRWEVPELDPEAIALEAGSRVENAFGTTLRRHLAQRGEYEGRLDPRFGL